MAKTNTEYSRERRARLKCDGLKEVRGIYSTPELEIKIKAAAKEINSECLGVPELIPGTKAALNKLGI